MRTTIVSSTLVSEERQASIPLNIPALLSYNFGHEKCRRRARLLGRAGIALNVAAGLDRVPKKEAAQGTRSPVERAHQIPFFKWLAELAPNLCVFVAKLRAGHARLKTI